MLKTGVLCYLLIILVGSIMSHSMNALTIEKALQRLLIKSTAKSQTLEEKYLQFRDMGNITTINDLLKRNKKFVKKALLEDANFFKDSSAPQHPEILMLSCSDSRISPEVVTLTHPGHLFVHRNVANLVNHNDGNFLSVLEYAVDVLKVKHIVVMGHYGCGGVHASMTSKAYGSGITTWITPIRDTRRMYQHELSRYPSGSDAYFRRLVELNVQEQVFSIRKSRIVQKALKSGQSLSFHGWVYDMETGLINTLKLDKKIWKSIAKIYSLKF